MQNPCGNRDYAQLISFAPINRIELDSIQSESRIMPNCIGAEIEQNQSLAFDRARNDGLHRQIPA
jgi:hypothetical protein